MDKKHLIVEQVHGCEGDCLVMDENRVAGPKPWGGGRVVKKWLLDRRQVEEIVKICKRFLGDADEDRWIPVTERLPEEWMIWVNDEHREPLEFLVFIDGAEIPTVLNFDGKRFCDEMDFYPVTHWMPLPEPPKEVQT